MPLTPNELRQLELRRRAGGYERESVDRVVEYMRQNYEEVWRERESLRVEVADYREVDAELRRTLVSAQRTADKLRAEAEHDGRAIVEQAHEKAAEVVGGIEAERDRMQAEVERLRELSSELRASYSTFLASAMELLENEDEATDEPEQWVFRPPGNAAEDDDPDAGTQDDTPGEGEAAERSHTG